MQYHAVIQSSARSAGALYAIGTFIAAGYFLYLAVGDEHRRRKQQKAERG